MSSQPEPVRFPLAQSVTWRIRVDAARCVGSGICVGTAPKLFAFDDGQHSQPVSELVEAGEIVRDVAAACPAEAISITDAETGAAVSLALGNQLRGGRGWRSRSCRTAGCRNGSPRKRAISPPRGSSTAS